VKAKIESLHPATIVVVGGVNSVSSAVFDELEGIQPNTVRQGGADRYEASRNLVESAFPDGASTVYVATGANFRDALSAGAAAATLKGSVLLVNGSASAPDAATIATLTELGTTHIVIAGGPNSVSTGVEDGFRALPGVTSVSRQVAPTASPRP
jgi:putative cell wall-binding protein